MKRLLALFLFSILIALAHPAFSNTTTPAETIVQQARSDFSKGRYTEAAQGFERSAQAYERDRFPLPQAISLSNLSLTQQKLGDWTGAKRSIDRSLALLNSLPNSSDRSAALASALSIQGHLQFAQGQAQAAVETWERAITLHPVGSDRALENQINQAQALQFLGLYRRATTTLTAVLNLDSASLETPKTVQSALETRSPTPTTIAALQSLGEALRLTGNLDTAQILLQQSLRMATDLQMPESIADAQFKLGNIRRSQAFSNLNGITLSKAVERINQAKTGRKFRDTEMALTFERQVNKAIQFYQQADSLSSSPTRQVQLKLNQLSLRLDLQQFNQQSIITQLRSQLDRLPLSRDRVDAQINLAQSLMKLPSNQPDIAPLLSTAAIDAQTLGYPRGQSYALGTLGRWYEQSDQTQASEKSLQQALTLAQAIQAPEMIYRWQWQLGRLSRQDWVKSGNAIEHDRAIARYQEAVTTLQSVRREMISSPLEDQFSFRDTIEPIHRELVELLLDVPQGKVPVENLKAARSVIESLQLNELVNFFRADCLIAKPEQIDQVDPTAAVFYPILLSNRMVVIVALPGQPLSYYATPLADGVSTARIDRMTNQIQLAIRQGNIPESEFLASSEQLYDWLIRPIRSQLEAQKIKTLVFIPDGGLRNIPMGVLRDRSQNQYLIQQYSIALTPGLQLLGSHPIPPGGLQALGGGLTSPRGGYSALPNVAAELQQVLSTLPNSRMLLNEQFTHQGVQTNIRSNAAPIVHLATHGQFSSQLDNTFILTWDGRLNVNELTSLLQNRDLQKTTLELLILSACETAAGDNRATLGLAGFAVRAGARSTIGTLWQVNDASSSLLMSQFYTELAHSQVTKAEALRRAQLHLLENAKTSNYRRPYYWAAYILVGNWQ
jgi:CHAT domain-containing protein/tetratricopeptide (TPR) repeat protein